MRDNDTSDYIFTAYVVNKQAYDNGDLDAGEFFNFPPNAGEVPALFEKIGLPPDATPDMYYMKEYASKVRELGPLLPMHGNIDDLAELAQGLHDLPHYERVKLDVVQVSPWRLTSLEQFKEYPQNVDYFCLDPTIHTDEALGWNWLHQQGLTDIPESCRGAIDPKPFGRYVREKEGGILTFKGYLTLSGDEWQHEQISRFAAKKEEKKPSIMDRLKQSKKENADQNKAQTHHKKSTPEH